MFFWVCSRLAEGSTIGACIELNRGGDAAENTFVIKSIDTLFIFVWVGSENGTGLACRVAEHGGTVRASIVSGGAHVDRSGRFHGTSGAKSLSAFFWYVPLAELVGCTNTLVLVEKAAIKVTAKTPDTIAPQPSMALAVAAASTRHAWRR